MNIKKIFYIISLILLLSLSAFAQHGNHGRGDGMRKRGGEFNRRLGNDPLQFFRKAGIILTEEQADKMYDIAINFIKQEEPVRLEIEKIDNNIRLELMKDIPNRDSLKNLIKDKKEQEAMMDYLRIVRDLDIIAVLTPEQKQQLHRCMMR